MPWRIEARKHFWPFAFAACAIVALGVAWLVVRSDTMLLVYSLTKMLVWFFVAGYCLYVLYSFYYLGSDVLMHLSPLPQRSVLLAKAVVLGSYLYALFLVALPFDVVQLGDTGHGNLLVVISYYLGAKAISIVSYLSLCLVAKWPRLVSMSITRPAPMSTSTRTIPWLAFALSAVQKNTSPG